MFLKIKDYRVSTDKIVYYYKHFLLKSNNGNNYYLYINLGSDNSIYIEYDSDEELDKAIKYLDEILETSEFQLIPKVNLKEINTPLFSESQKVSAPWSGLNERYTI